MKRILILCRWNSVRSQMAEGLLKFFGKDRFEVHSAGLEASGLNPLAVKVMGDMGIDISEQRSKSVNEFLGQDFDCVITVCDSMKESCPVFPGSPRRIHWSLPDPAAAQGTEQERLTAFRRVRDDLAKHLQALVASIR